MTDAPEIDGRKRRGGLFVYDTEICERLNIPKKDGMRLLRMLDGFPPQIPELHGRRYWPAVQAYFDRAYGLPGEPERRVYSRPVNPQTRKTA